MKKKLLLVLFGASTMFAVAQTPFTGCPGNNLAILRKGTNSDTDPISIYTINAATGALTLLSGPILDPANAAVNLQVNGLGLNTVDGLLYGLSATSNAVLTTNTPLPFYRIGANAVAVQTGIMKVPLLGPGENQAFVMPAAGETDLTNDYYFTAATAAIDFTVPTIQVKRIFIGKLSSISSLSVSNTNLLSPSYVPITSTDINCNNYLASLTTLFNKQNYADAENTGLKDLVFDKVSGKLFSYVTYPDPAKTGTYMGMMVSLNPVTGILAAVAPPVTLSYASATNEVTGLLLDKEGIFLVLFTNGNVYRANSSAPGVFDGSISPLNLHTGLPTTIRGDMTSCGAAMLLPVVLNYFSVYGENNTAVVKWETGSEVNASRFIIERSLDGLIWSAIQTISSTGNSSTAKQYQYIDKDISAKTFFYRLKLADADGAAKYSAIKKVSFGTSNGSISYYPNPVANILYAESDIAFSDKLQIQISNAAGRTYTTSFRKNAVNKISIDISAFPAGIYFLQIGNGTGNNSIQKIIKQ